MSAVLKIGKESAIISWREGKVYAAGYDIENERLYLSINGNIGEGIGVALVALDDLKVQEIDLRRIVEEFNGWYDNLTPGYSFGWVTIKRPLFLLEYLSYSPDMVWRRTTTEVGDLRPQTWQRLLKDNEVLVANNALSKAVGITDDLLPFVHCQDVGKRVALALNPSLPKEAAKYLACGDEWEVRYALKLRYKLEEEVLEIINAYNADSDAATIIAEAEEMMESAANKKKEANEILKKGQEFRALHPRPSREEFEAELLARRKEKEFEL